VDAAERPRNDRIAATKTAAVSSSSSNGSTPWWARRTVAHFARTAAYFARSTFALKVKWQMKSRGMWAPILPMIR
jgi:hypothetical protein